MTPMTDNKEVTLPTQDGSVRTYTIFKFPAVQGREIVAKYPLSSMPKIGEYEVNQEVMLKAMCYVGVPLGDTGELQMLTTLALVNNHVPDWETLARLEMVLLEYNVSFFGNGVNSVSFETLIQQAPAWITKTLTPLFQQLLQAVKQPTTN